MRTLKTLAELGSIYKWFKRGHVVSMTSATHAQSNFRSDASSVPAMTQKLSVADRRNCALAESEPHDAATAFEKATALMEMGEEFAREAIANFERAVELDAS